MTKEEVRAVIDRVLAGDADAFEVLVAANQRKVYNLCLRMTGNAEDAEDLAQEAFFRAYQNLASYKGESAFSAWLYRLTSNVCIDHLRRERKREKSSLTYLDESGAPQEIDIPDERFAPERTLERRQVGERIQEGLDTLTPEHRKILILRELGGLSYDEIAARLGLSAGTVKSRISRARQSLSKFLLEDWNFSVEMSSERVPEERKGE